jgi:hypothetical protein
MKACFLVTLLAFCVSLPLTATATEPSVVLTGGGGVLVPGAGSRQPCEGELLFHGDGGEGGYENGYAWQYGGILGPYYGAFADLFSELEEICAVFFDFTRAQGYERPDSIDVYLWADADGLPGNVLMTLPDVYVAQVPVWPNFARFFVELPENVTLPVWIGYWGDWPGQRASCFIGADLDGQVNPGTPMTNIAPGLGYPTGWQSVDVIWGADRRTVALGLGAVVDSGPVPVDRSTWGEVKSLYR